MCEKGKCERKEISNCHPPTIFGPRVAPRPPFSYTQKINMSTGSYLHDRTILFLAFERIRAIICILLEASGSTSMHVIARSASPLGPAAHHYFAFAVRKRDRQRGERRSEIRRENKWNATNKWNSHDWKNSERVVNSRKKKNEIKLRQSDDLTMQVTVDHVANKIPFVCCNCSLIKDAPHSSW